MKGYRRNTTGNIIATILVAVLFVILLAVAAYIPYRLQQNTIDDLNSKVSSLNSQLQHKQTSPSSSTSTTTTTYTSKSGVKITVYQPQSNAVVSSPVAVIGLVPGNWSFEATFPAKLVDSQGNVVAQTTAHVVGDWMTSQPTPFSAQFTYTAKPTGNGTLVLQKDNPSGQPANDDSVSIPIKF
ncbi:MAG TPA: Gmad2 immunoglobulin-like domain-containing protein [Candidatus Saccharimonadales bacterium]|nr:Gmad2 immunoglobulin-like domain-containing protein [Candidatus Saccharimonadales bacterium]